MSSYAAPLDTLVRTGRYRPPHRPNHAATDYRAAVGTPLYASIDGTVRVGTGHAAAGTWVEIRGGNTMVGYNHMSRLSVKSGERVKAGQLIGYSGNTGRTTAPHLHFYVEVNGKRVNPEKWLKEVLAKPKPKADIGAMALEVLAGAHGNGHDNRRKSLGVSKAVYEQVRAEVNRRAGGAAPKPSKTVSQMATEVIQGKHGNGHANRRKSLGINAATYAKVRAEVNRRM